jgi:hypothetical protein
MDIAFVVPNNSEGIYQGLSTEQMPSSSLGSLMSQTFTKELPHLKLHSFCLSDEYLFSNSGKKSLNEENGLSYDKIAFFAQKLITG